jgi:hypothetical protein
VVHGYWSVNIVTASYVTAKTYFSLFLASAVLQSSFSLYTGVEDVGLLSLLWGLLKNLNRQTFFHAGHTMRQQFK